ncbi:MAG: MFS transporter [Armatimonadota bacterium]|nr:MFS transporter [Armatimonadota bacterium]MDR7497401.1 MFS transporter [Armatimonadota bacterium]MDR7511888.1 MFS transporter [Armatimonadota bacterium]
MDRSPPPRVHYAWVVLGATMLVLLTASGVRSSFGVFIKPLEAEFGWARTSLSAVAALSLFLYGAVGPLVGRLADRWGPRGVLTAALALLGAGALATATVGALWQLYLTAGLLTALGGGAAAMSVAASLVARWFDTRRGLVLGLAGGGMAAGQLLVVPALMAATLAWGWRASYVAVGLGALLLAPLVLLIVRNEPEELGLAPYGATPGAHPVPAGARAAQRTGIVAAARTAPFWLLAGSFWVCGYTTSGLVLTHLIPHATEHGFHAAQAAQALGVMGALNIVGTVASGWICDRFGARGPLTGYYLLRGLSLIFLPYVGTVPGLFAFAAVFGLNYISTVPATTALTARLFGRYSVGELSGWIFFSHQIGAAVGSMVGGFLYDRFGTYTPAFHSAAAMALLAAVMVAAIRTRPKTPQPQAPVRAEPVPATASGG